MQDNAKRQVLDAPLPDAKFVEQTNAGWGKCLIPISRRTFAGQTFARQTFDGQPKN